MKFLTTLRHRMRYAKAKRNNKNFKSSIRTCRTFQCRIVRANRFDEFNDYEMAYHMSSIYTLISFDIESDSSLIHEFESLINTLNMYGFRFIAETIDGIKYVIIEGSIADYDNLIDLYYNHLRYGASDNIFVSNIVRELKFIPIQYFKNTAIDGMKNIWMGYDSNQFSTNKSRYKDIRDHEIEDSIILIEDDRGFEIPEIENDDFKSSRLYDMINNISCVYVAIATYEYYDDISNYSDAMFTKENRYEQEFTVYKIRYAMLAKYLSETNNEELRKIFCGESDCDYSYDRIATDINHEINNDEYYKDIDEVIDE